MDLKASTVQGGVLIVHQLHEGKHQYEVGNVVKYKKMTGEKMFVRRGDKLLQINGVDLQLLTPEELAQMLADGNPMLKVHKASRMKEPYEPPSPGEDILHPVSKESTSFSFSMEMQREEEGDGGGEGEGGEGGGEDEGLLEDVCKGELDADGEDKDLLVVTMKKTSVSVVRGRACNPNSPCQGCNGVGCMYNDVVMVTESSTVTLVSRGSTYKKTKEQVNVSMEHVASHQYLRSLCSQKSLYASPNPENITIYHYKSTIIGRSFKGVAVVLNFTNSNCFLRCCCEDGRVFLRVETCEKQRLKQISKDDKSTLSFVFYMKKAQARHMTFESALHRGWFIQILNTQTEVRIEQPEQQDEHSFLFVIQKSSESL